MKWKAIIKSKCRESIRFMKAGMPLPGQEFLFVGDDDYGHFTTGDKYRVIAMDYFFHPPYEYGIFMTQDEHPETSDIDFGCFVPVEHFKREFRRC